MAIIDPKAVAIQPPPVKYDHLVVNNFAAALNPDTGRKGWAFTCGMAADNGDGTLSFPKIPQIANAACDDAVTFIGQCLATASGQTIPPELAPASAAFAQAMIALDAAIQQAAAAAVNFYRLRGDAQFVSMPALTVQ